jgi:hypothetical protein
MWSLGLNGLHALSETQFTSIVVLHYRRAEYCSRRSPGFGHN